MNPEKPVPASGIVAREVLIPFPWVDSLQLEPNDEIDEIRVAAGHPQEGMLLSRDVMHPDGFLLLSKCTVLMRRLIDQLITVERDAGRRLEIYILRQRVGHSRCYSTPNDQFILRERRETRIWF